MVYYPACGPDKLPKQVFGAYHIIHLSLPEDEPQCGYLESLGDGIKLLGDMRHSNLADCSINLIYTTPAGTKLTQEMVADFDRVLKPSGIVAVESYGYNYTDREKWQKNFELFQKYHYIVLDLPTEFKSGQVVWGIRPDKQDPELGGFNGWYVNSEQAMIEFVTSHKGHHGFEEILDYAVFQKV